jgi:F-type H+-transporting ATPase subunit gamma
MPGGKERVLKRRITSVQSTKKITRAMELIAATRVVKAMQRANQARPYSSKITGVIEDLAAGGTGIDDPLLRSVEDPQTSAYVVITSDRGLAGAYNSSVIRAAEREVMAGQVAGKGYKLVLIGKKANDYFKFRKYDIHASFEGMTDAPTYEHAREVAGEVREMFVSGDVDQVILAYQEFVSMGTQQVAVRRFLPLESMQVVAEAGGGDAAAKALFEFEPSPEGVLSSLLPRYVESRLFSALLDASASEHANRQRAMKAATDNAEELITNLSRALNRARQDSITTEIMEIVSGAEALGDGSSDAEELPIQAALQLVGVGGGSADGSAAASSVASSSTATATLEAGPHGEGSHAPLPDNSAPAGFTIKGNADSMLYHRPDSRSYSVTIAEVWFDTPERAEAAGFSLANTHPSS